MVSRNDVINCYKYILGREPESDAVISGHQSKNNLEELIHSFFESTEFVSKLKSYNQNLENQFPPQNWYSGNIATICDDMQLSKMMMRIQKEWEGFGQTEPYWSVLTHDNFKQENIKLHYDHFYDSGRHVIEIILSYFNRQNIPYSNYSNCFELGSGLGRITIHLADIFPKVIASDISSPHLAILKEVISKKNLKNIEVQHLKSPEKIFEIGEIDL